MLYEFLTRERDTILMAVKQKVLETQGSRAPLAAQESGGSIFYDELLGVLKRDSPFALHAEKGIHTVQAEKRGKEYWRLGYTISEVVSGYGNLCQVITQLATQRNFEITSREFRQLNLSLDTAIAEAVTEYAKASLAECNLLETGRLDYLASELSICQEIMTVLLKMGESTSFEAWSNTAGALQHSLQGMVEFIDTSLAEVRSRSEWEHVDRPNPIFLN